MLPGTSQPVTGQPVTGQPVTGKPVTSQPSTGQPVTSHLIPGNSHWIPVTSHPGNQSMVRSTSHWSTSHQSTKHRATSHQSSDTRQQSLGTSNQSSRYWSLCQITRDWIPVTRQPGTSHQAPGTSQFNRNRSSNNTNWFEHLVAIYIKEFCVVIIQ